MELRRALRPGAHGPRARVRTCEHHELALCDELGLAREGCTTPLHVRLRTTLRRREQSALAKAAKAQGLVPLATSVVAAAPAAAALGTVATAAAVVVEAATEPERDAAMHCEVSGAVAAPVAPVGGGGGGSATTFAPQTLSADDSGGIATPASAPSSPPHHHPVDAVGEAVVPQIPLGGNALHPWKSHHEA